MIEKWTEMERTHYEDMREENEKRKRGWLLAVMETVMVEIRAKSLV